MANIKIFPIGYVSSDNSTSKGTCASGGTPKNVLFEPNAGCNKTKSGFSLVSEMENRAIWARKVGEHKHQLTYSYENIFNWEFKQIRRFTRDVAEYRANSFYVIDFSSGQKVTALATGSTWNASIYDTTDFSATTAEGGNYVCIWYPHQSKFRIGKISNKYEDSSISFSNTGDFGDLSDFSLGHVFAYPVYRVYLGEDAEAFEVTEFIDSHLEASFIGPIRSGDVSFVQKDTR